MNYLFRLTPLVVLFQLCACVPDHTAPLAAPKVASSAASLQPQLCSCAAPPPPANYLVYFDPGKYGLRSKTLSILTMVVVDDKRLSFGHIYVSAFIDSSDSPPYDNKLAWKRANAVEEQLVADGIPRSKLEIVPNSVVDKYVPPEWAFHPLSWPAQYRRVVEIQGDKSRIGTTNFLHFVN